MEMSALLLATRQSPTNRSHSRQHIIKRSRSDPSFDFKPTKGDTCSVQSLLVTVTDANNAGGLVNSDEYPFAKVTLSELESLEQCEHPLLDDVNVTGLVSPVDSSHADVMISKESMEQYGRPLVADDETFSGLVALDDRSSAYVSLLEDGVLYDTMHDKSRCSRECDHSTEEYVLRKVGPDDKSKRGRNLASAFVFFSFVCWIVYLVLCLWIVKYGSLVITDLSPETSTHRSQLLQGEDNSKIREEKTGKSYDFYDTPCLLTNISYQDDVIKFPFSKEDCDLLPQNVVFEKSSTMAIQESCLYNNTKMYQRRKCVCRGRFFPSCDPTPDQFNYKEECIEEKVPFCMNEGLDNYEDNGQMLLIEDIKCDCSQTDYTGDHCHLPKSFVCSLCHTADCQDLINCSQARTLTKKDVCIHAIRNATWKCQPNIGKMDIDLKSCHVYHKSVGRPSSFPITTMSLESHSESIDEDLRTLQKRHVQQVYMVSRTTPEPSNLLLTVSCLAGVVCQLSFLLIIIMTAKDFSCCSLNNYCQNTFLEYLLRMSDNLVYSASIGFPCMVFGMIPRSVEGQVLLVMGILSPLVLSYIPRRHFTSKAT